MIDMVTFFVPGIPVPQGSKTLLRRGGRTWMTDANAARLREWRAVVAAHADCGREFDAPVNVHARFVLPKPQRPRWPVPAVRPDVDKLARALLDGMTDAGLLADDSRVVELTVAKVYGPEPGVRVEVVPW